MPKPAASSGPPTENQPLLEPAEADDPSPEAVEFGQKTGGCFASCFKSHLLRKAIERTSTTFYDAASFEESIWPAAVGPAFFLTLWASIVVSIYELTDVFNSFPSSFYFCTVIGVAFGYLMVFRTNTAHERFWEGRRLWSQLNIQIVNFGRILWTGVNAPEGKTLTPDDIKGKEGAMNLLVALCVSIKYHLKGKGGTNHKDLMPYVKFIPELADGISYSSLPLDIILHIGAYISDVQSKKIIDGSSAGSLTGALSGFTETLTYFERICYTPIPRAYHIYIKQTLLVYIASLPFQITQLCHWWTIPIVFFGGGTLLGMEAIAREIENPFGDDYNDLPQDEYISYIRRQLVSIMQTPPINVSQWGTPCDLYSMDQTPLNDERPIIIVQHQTYPHRHV